MAGRLIAPILAKLAGREFGEARNMAGRVCVDHNISVCPSPPHQQRGENKAKRQHTGRLQPAGSDEPCDDHDHDDHDAVHSMTQPSNDHDAVSIRNQWRIIYRRLKSIF